MDAFSDTSSEGAGATPDAAMLPLVPACSSAACAPRQRPAGEARGLPIGGEGAPRRFPRAACAAGLAVATLGAAACAWRGSRYRGWPGSRPAALIEQLFGEKCCEVETEKCPACRVDADKGSWSSRVSDDGEGDPFSSWSMKTLRSRANLRLVGGLPGEGCCKRKEAKCRACAAGQTVKEYCVEDAHSRQNVPGCNGYCGVIEPYHVYPGGDIQEPIKTAHAMECCAKCRAEPRCSSWTWGKDLKCHLKDQIEFKRVRNGYFTSGLPGKDATTFMVKLRHGTCLGIDAIDGLPKLANCSVWKHTDQQWMYDRHTSHIIARHGACLEAPLSDVKGGKVLLRKCAAGETRQQWNHTGISGLIRSQHNHLCLRAPPEKGGNDAVQVWPCNGNSQEQQWSMWSVNHVTENATKYWIKLEGWTRKQNSLLCFSLMTPWGNEKELLKLQYKEHKSIFACDESVVYSDAVIDLGGVKTKVVHTDLHCPKGGQFHTSLNTRVFVKLWDQLIVDGLFRFHDWTVKVDPDAVFLPWRLTDIVWRQEYNGAQQGQGVFFQNCKQSLHGPVEVLSRRALQAYNHGRWHCPWHDQEDWYLSACLIKLGVKPMSVNDLLADKACPHDLWRSCTEAQAVFHPFKTLKTYRECWGKATMHGTWKS